MSGSRGTGQATGAAGGRGDSWRRDRIWQAGFLVGSVLGAAATVIGRRAERSARRGLVDWQTVERLAIERLRTAPGSLDQAELASAEPVYDAAMQRIVPALSAALGTELPGIVERSSVIDRAGWVRANISTFQGLVARLEREVLDEVVPEGGGLAKASLAIVNRMLTTRQLAVMLAFMGRRVLGQYDLALITAEATPGRLLFVDENIRQIARSIEVPLDPFRTWIALHETTHAFEFEAHPWLRPYLAERIERQIGAFSSDVTTIGREGIRGLGRLARGGASGMHWMERLMTPEQRRLFRETQAVMSLLEGFGDYVMDEVGRDLVPGVARISRRFHERRDRRTGLERIMLRVTGMDLKMDQYRQGERFVAGIAARGGSEALRRLWEGPETLPTAQEIEAPDRWVARVMRPAGGVA